MDNRSLIFLRSCAVAGSGVFQFVAQDGAAKHGRPPDGADGLSPAVAYAYDDANPLKNHPGAR